MDTGLDQADAHGQNKAGFNFIALVLSALLIPVVSGGVFMLPWLFGVTSVLHDSTPLTTGVISIVLVTVPTWVIYANSAKQNRSLSDMLLPVFITSFYYLLAWIVLYGLSGYSGESVLIGIFTAPYFFYGAVFALIGGKQVFSILLIVQLITSVATATLMSVLKKRAVKPTARVWAVSACVLTLCVVAGYQAHEGSTLYLSRSVQGESVGSEINYYEYTPFMPDNKLEELEGDASVVFLNDYPKLDGATAAYPVYGAIAQELYQGVSEDNVGDYVRCSTTAEAYQRLINGQTDLFFGAEPSKSQIADAEARGITFEMTALGKEAFVFFVNADNPVDGLTTAQIQDIYQKKITNWAEVGGNSEPILAFQRPENSGSQTIMEAKVMGDKALAPPLQYESVVSMSGTVGGVAEYRNTAAAIGYSFRYFTTDMAADNRIKLLAIDGVEPSVANIRNGSYPLTIDFYAVSARPRSANTNKLVDWCLSDQGQAFIEQCGYVGISSARVDTVP